MKRILFSIALLILSSMACGVPPSSSLPTQTQNTVATVVTESPTVSLTSTPDPFCENTILCLRFNGQTESDFGVPYDIKFKQENGTLALFRETTGFGEIQFPQLRIDEIVFFEAKISLDSDISGEPGAQIHIENSDWWLSCSINGSPQRSQAACYTSDGYYQKASTVKHNEWHTLRFEVDPDTAVISFFFDGQKFGSYITPLNRKMFKETYVTPGIGVLSREDGLVTGYFEDVRIGQR